MEQGQDILVWESGHLRLSPWCHVTTASPFPSLIKVYEIQTGTGGGWFRMSIQAVGKWSA